MMSETVDFFIAGFPKCGTTSLASFLARHPNICFSDPKEPGLYCPEFSHKQKITSIQEYRKLFKNRTESDITGEGTVIYIYSPTAIQSMKQQKPDCKLIIMLRNPIDLVCSLHSNQFRALEEDRSDLGEAWALQGERLKGNLIPRACREPFFLQYKEIASQGKYLCRLYEHFEKKNVLPVFLEDFTSNPQAEYRRIQRFLEVPQVDHFDYGEKLNVNMEFRADWIGSLGQRTLRIIRNRNLQTAKKKLGLGNLQLEKKLRQLSLVRSVRRPISPDLRHEMISAFTSDIALLEVTLERDLSHWKK